MELPILALPYWIADRVNVANLTANNLHDLENSLSDEELVWIMSLHKIQPFQDILTELHKLHDSDRMRKLSTYQLSGHGVMHACSRFLRVPIENTDTQRHLKPKVCTTPNLHVMLLSYTAVTIKPVHLLAKQICDNTSFTQMSNIANGALLTKYIN